MSDWAYRLRKLREHPRPGRFIVGRLLWRTGLSPLFVREMPRGFRIRFYPSSISAALWSDPGSRHEDEDFVWAVLRPGDRFIDAGANIGQLALAASKRVGPEGEVIAVEAHPEIHRYLEGNVALNRTSNLRTLNYALGASTGEVTMTSGRSDDQNFVTEGGQLRVPMRALDDLIAIRPTRLLKIDVEGSELPVLQGASAVLDETEVVYCELSTGNCRRFGYEPEEVEHLLLKKGFVFIRRDREGQAEVTASAYFASLSRQALPATGYNLVAVRPEVAPELVSLLTAEGWFAG